MASNRMIRRELERQRLVAKHASRRAELVEKLKKPMDLDEKFKIIEQIEALPRDASSVRLTRRCVQTGRAHGVYRKFALCRNALRKTVMNGEAPGCVMSSW